MYPKGLKRRMNSSLKGCSLFLLTRMKTIGILETTARLFPRRTSWALSVFLHETLLSRKHMQTFIFNKWLIYVSAGWNGMNSKPVSRCPFSISSMNFSIKSLGDVFDDLPFWTTVDPWNGGLIYAKGTFLDQCSGPFSYSTSLAAIPHRGSERASMKLSSGCLP